MAWIIGTAAAALAAGFLAGRAWSRRRARLPGRRRGSTPPSTAAEEEHRRAARRQMEYRNFLCYNGDACPDPEEAARWGMRDEGGRRSSGGERMW